MALFDLLSPREKQALDLYCRCGSCKLVGVFMMISSRTVSNYLERARKKLCIGSTVEMVYLYGMFSSSVS